MIGFLVVEVTVLLAGQKSRDLDLVPIPGFRVGSKVNFARFNPVSEFELGCHASARAAWLATAQIWI